MFFIERVEFLLLRVVHVHSSVTALDIEYVRNGLVVIQHFCRVAASFNKRLQNDNLRAVQIAMLASSHCMAIRPSHKLRLSWTLEAKRHEVPDKNRPWL